MAAACGMVFSGDGGEMSKEMKRAVSLAASYGLRAGFFVIWKCCMMVEDSDRSEGGGGLVGLFFEKIIEVGGLFEAEAVADLGDVPVGVS
jgi:hypothetical protein